MTSHLRNPITKLFAIIIVVASFLIYQNEAQAALPTYQAKGTFTSGTGALTVPTPAGYADNDVFLLFISSANQAITTPTGWTEVTNSPQFTGTAAAAGGIRLSVFYKVVSGAQSSVSVVDSGNYTAAIIANFRGVDTSSPIHITSGGVDATATTAISTPSITTTIGNTIIINAIGLDKDADDTNTITSALVNANLTNLTERHDETVRSGVGGGIAFFTGEKATAGTVGATTATADSSTTHAYITIALKPIPIAPTVASPTATSITTTSATLGADITSLGEPASLSARGICYGLSASPTNCISSGTAGGVFTQSVTGLTPGTLYYYRGYATNSTGTGYSADGTFTTLAITGSVSASPTTCTILSGASTCTVPFTWSISNATSPNLYNATTASTYSTSASGTGVSYPITNGANTVQARDNSTVLASTSATASCENGSSWNGSICAATPAIPTVTSPTATSITTTGATLGANVTSLGVPASISARGTCWGTSPSPVTNCVAEGGTTTGIFTHARTGMSPGVFYYYRGYATNSTGTGYSADGTFTTLAITGSVSASPTTCTILSGASTCTVPLTWSISNATSPNLYNATTASTYSTSASGTGVSFAITNGSNTVQVRDSSTVLNSTTATGSCDVGTSWNGSICAATPAIPTVTSPTATSITTIGATLGANITSAGVPATLTARGTCWGTSPSPVTNCAAEGGTTTGIFTHARTGMSPGVFYYYRGYATNSTGTGYSADGTFTTLSAGTTIADGTTPTSVTVAPESGIIDLDYFTLQTNTGSDTVTAATVTLSPSGAYNNIAQVDITDNSNVAQCTAVTNPASNTISFTTCILSVTTSASTFKVRITPKTHLSMPVPPGASYATAGTVTAFTSTNAQSGTDGSSATITIDNLSPGATSGELVSAGDAQTSVSWTNPGDSDFSNVVVLRDTATIGSGSTPGEGSSPTVGSSCGGTACQARYISSGTSFTDTSLANGTTYYYRFFAKDTHGNYTAYGSTQEVTGTPTATPTTTLSSGTDPISTTIAPGASETDVNEFTFQTNTGSETITSITVNLSTNNGVAILALTNSSNATIGSVLSPSAGLNTIPVNISVSTGGTTYKVRITPLSHTAMPATPGATYTITAPVTTWVGSYAHTGADTNADALTIDNLSPLNVPASSVTAGNAQVSISWTNPADTDFTTGGSVLVLRNTILVSDTPTEGLAYLLGGSVGASIAACVIGGTPPSTSCTDIGLTNGTPYHYKIFTQDSRGNYSATGAIPSNSPATPSIVILPTYAITASAGTGGTVLPAGVTDVTQGNSQTYIITPNSGYSIDTLTIDGATTTPVTSYTFTNVQTTHTINATFIAQEGETPTAGPILASITFDGKAFPKGTVSILHKELDVQILDGQQDISNITGSFHVRFVDLPKSIHSFGLLIKDPEGRASQTKFYLVDANATNPLFENIVAPPTIDVLNGQVTRGGVAKIFGYASPSHTVRLYLNDILFKEVLAGNSGVYSFDISTGALDFGQYKVRAKQINLDGGRESDFSTSKNFIVSRLAVVKADLNGDGKVDIRDWSIFLSRWGSKTSLGRAGIDLNGDGKVDIADFSIFIKTVRK